MISGRCPSPACISKPVRSSIAPERSPAPSRFWPMANSSCSTRMACWHWQLRQRTVWRSTPRLRSSRLAVGLRRRSSVGRCWHGTRPRSCRSSFLEELRVETRPLQLARVCLRHPVRDRALGESLFRLQKQLKAEKWGMVPPFLGCVHLSDFFQGRELGSCREGGGSAHSPSGPRLDLGVRLLVTRSGLLPAPRGRAFQARHSNCSICPQDAMHAEQSQQLAENLHPPGRSCRPLASGRSCAGYLPIATCSFGISATRTLRSHQ